MISLNDLYNKIFYDESLKLLKNFPDNFIPLIYIDPPFFTQTEQKTTEYSFSDKWDSFSKYIDFMKEIIHHCHRVLHSEGSFYCHCDYRASHHLKTVCDDIFGYNFFRSEIIWKRTKSANYDNNKFSVITDSIFYYTKSNSYTFNPIYIPLSQKQIERDYRYIEKRTGRRYTTSPLIKGGNSPKALVFKDRGKIIAPKNKRFIWSQVTYDDHIKKNPHLIVWTKNGLPRCKIYADEHKGVPLSNLWLDINNVTETSKESLNYPNQKPEQLLKRIIHISSNPNDIVADLFCGSGTTLAVAKKLKRKWIGIDNNKDAITLTKKRMHKINVFKDFSHFF